MVGKIQTLTSGPKFRTQWLGPECQMGRANCGTMSSFMSLAILARPFEHFKHVLAVLFKTLTTEGALSNLFVEFCDN